MFEATRRAFIAAVGSIATLSRTSSDNQQSATDDETPYCLAINDSMTDGDGYYKDDCPDADLRIESAEGGTKITVVADFEDPELLSERDFVAVTFHGKNLEPEPDL